MAEQDNGPISNAGGREGTANLPWSQHARNPSKEIKAGGGVSGLAEERSGAAGCPLPMDDRGPPCLSLGYIRTNTTTLLPFRLLLTPP